MDAPTTRPDGRFIEAAFEPLEEGAPSLGRQDDLHMKLLVTKGIAGRSKDATSSSWPYY